MRLLIERLERGEQFVVLRHNRPVGALISYQQFVRLTSKTPNPQPHKDRSTEAQGGG
jgi:antitoxin (DNA-binding transcriptional repressor) of toxin-antitoxin stability system